MREGRKAWVWSKLLLNKRFEMWYTEGSTLVTLLYGSLFMDLTAASVCSHNQNEERHTPDVCSNGADIIIWVNKRVYAKKYIRTEREAAKRSFLRIWVPRGGSWVIDRTDDAKSATVPGHLDCGTTHEHGKRKRMGLKITRRFPSRRRHLAWIIFCYCRKNGRTFSCSGHVLNLAC